MCNKTELNQEKKVVVCFVRIISMWNGSLLVELYALKKWNDEAW